MRKSIAQESDYGCGVACFAFVTNLTYKQAVQFLGREQSVKHGWRPSDLTSALNKYGLHYKNRYVRKSNDDTLYPDGTIILIERSEVYAVGHYLVRYGKRWMDPWINLPEDDNISQAKSGFRNSLPGRAMYALIPSK